MENDWLWKNYKKTEEYFLNKVNENINDPYKLHFTYNQLIKLYDKNKTKHKDAPSKLVDICKKDMELFPAFEKVYREVNPEYNFIPIIPSFKTLAILYEKQKNYKEALEVSELALSFGLDDGAKVGYTGRISRIKKKLFS